MLMWQNSYNERKSSSSLNIGCTWPSWQCTTKVIKKEFSATQMGANIMLDAQKFIGSDVEGNDFCCS